MTARLVLAFVRRGLRDVQRPRSLGAVVASAPRRTCPSTPPVVARLAASAAASSQASCLASCSCRENDRRCVSATSIFRLANEILVDAVQLGEVTHGSSLGASLAPGWTQAPRALPSRSSSYSAFEGFLVVVCTRSICAALPRRRRRPRSVLYHRKVASASPTGTTREAPRWCRTLSGRVRLRYGR